MNDNIELACFINYIMRTYIKSFVFVLLCFMHMSFCSSHSDVSVEEILRKHIITFTEPPKRIPSQHSVDAPLLGNGYTGVACSLKLFLPGKEVIRENPPHELFFPDERESGTVNGDIQYISRAYDDSVDIKTKASAAYC